MKLTLYLRAVCGGGAFGVEAKKIDIMKNLLRQ